MGRSRRLAPSSCVALWAIGRESATRRNRKTGGPQMVKDDVKLGRDVAIFQPDLVNLYGCEIGDQTKVGAFVEIRKGVKIGARCKIQAFAFIPEGVTVEDGVFIGP